MPPIATILKKREENWQEKNYEKNIKVVDNYLSQAI